MTDPQLHSIILAFDPTTGKTHLLQWTYQDTDGDPEADDHCWYEHLTLDPHDPQLGCDGLAFSQDEIAHMHVMPYEPPTMLASLTETERRWLSTTGTQDNPRACYGADIATAERLVKAGFLSVVFDYRDGTGSAAGRTTSYQRMDAISVECTAWYWACVRTELAP